MTMNETKQASHGAVAGPVEPTVRQHLETEHVAWCRYVTQHERPTRIVICDSDAPGAFKVYRPALACGVDRDAALKQSRREPLTRQQIDDVMTQHYPLSSLLREEVDAFEACVRDLERLHGIGPNV
jgi:hypothetical protein